MTTNGDLKIGRSGEVCNRSWRYHHHPTVMNTLSPSNSGRRANRASMPVNPDNGSTLSSVLRLKIYVCRNRGEDRVVPYGWNDDGYTLDVLKLGQSSLIVAKDRRATVRDSHRNDLCSSVCKSQLSSESQRGSQRSRGVKRRTVSILHIKGISECCGIEERSIGVLVSNPHRRPSSHGATERASESERVIIGVQNRIDTSVLNLEVIGGQCIDHTSVNIRDDDAV